MVLRIHRDRRVRRILDIRQPVPRRDRHAPSSTRIVCFAFSAVVCWFVAYKDIRVSSLLTLFLEGLSIAVILGVCVVVLFGHGGPVDTAQLSLHGDEPEKHGPSGGHLHLQPGRI